MSISEVELTRHAKKLARECRHVIQGILREEEWIDFDCCVTDLLRDGIRRILADDRRSCRQKTLPFGVDGIRTD